MCFTTLGMDNFDCTKMNAHFKKFTACLREELIHEWKQALLASPLPLVSLNNSRFCSTHNQLLWRLERSTNNILCILVKAQPSTQNTWLWSPTRLGIWLQNLGLLNKYSLGHCSLSAALDTSLLSQAGITHYSQQLKLQYSTKLLLFELIFKVVTATRPSTRPHLN